MKFIHRVPTRKTWKGRTPGSLLAKAYVAQMGADNWEIISDEFPGVLFEKSDRDELVLYDETGTITILETFGRGFVRLLELVKQRRALEVNHG
jgi:hypothetical protein